MSAYQPSIPTGLVNLDVDYQNLQNNFQQLDTTFGVDHTLFSNQTAQNGYHKLIHQIPSGSDPGPMAGINQIYSKTVLGDTQLFVMSAGGGESQLTGNRNAQFGYQYIGGVLLQWGFATVSTGSTTQVGTVKFTDNGLFNYSANPFNVNLTLVSKTGGTSSSNNSLFLINGSVTTAGFKWGLNVNTAGDFVSFFWSTLGVP